METLDIHEIAEVCHEANRALCLAFGDTSQPKWRDAPDWQRESAIKGVIACANRDLGPEELHEEWMRKKTIEGWVYGPKKDPEKKEHPCMVPFRELPPDQQAKDFVFRAIVRILVGKDA